MTIGSEIRQLRENYDLTQSQLGTVLGVTAQAVYYWERDEFRPAAHQLESLAQMWNAMVDPTHRQLVDAWIRQRLANEPLPATTKAVVGGSALVAAAAAVGLGLLLFTALTDSEKPKRKGTKSAATRKKRK